jgi:chromosome partitioning protein
MVPISPDYLSGIGVGLLLKRVKELTEDLEHSLDHVGIIISRVGRPALHREQTVAAIRQQFGEKVLRQEIHERVAVSEAAAQKIPIFDHGDRTAGSEFTAVAVELLHRLGLTK